MVHAVEEQAAAHSCACSWHPWQQAKPQVIHTNAPSGTIALRLLLMYSQSCPTLRAAECAHTTGQPCAAVPIHTSALTQSWTTSRNTPPGRSSWLTSAVTARVHQPRLRACLAPHPSTQQRLMSSTSSATSASSPTLSSATLSAGR